MRVRHILGVIGAATAALVLAGSIGAAQTRMPFTQALDNPCTGEMLVATGTLVEDVDLTTSPDGRTHFRSRVSFHGMAATAPLTGHKYVVQEQTLEGTNSDADAAPYTTHFKVKLHWVRTGEDGGVMPDNDDDFYDWFHVHMTVNANGVPTSTKIDVEDDVCR